MNVQVHAVPDIGPKPDKFTIFVVDGWPRNFDVGTSRASQKVGFGLNGVVRNLNDERDIDNVGGLVLQVGEDENVSVR